MNRATILETARDCITRDRAATHGEAEDSFAAIARVWQWWLDSRAAGPLTPFDVAAMMAAFKLARMVGNPAHEDNAVDLCGYGALAGEMGQREAEQRAARADMLAKRALYASSLFPPYTPDDPDPGAPWQPAGAGQEAQVAPAAGMTAGEQGRASTGQKSSGSGIPQEGRQ